MKEDILDHQILNNKKAKQDIVNYGLIDEMMI